MRSPQDAATAEQAGGVSPYLLWIIWIFWLFFLVQPLSLMLAPPSTPQKMLSIGGIALFTGIYLWITWQEAWRLSRETPTRADPAWKSLGPSAVLLALSVIMIFAQGQSALGSLIYVSSSLCGRLTAWRAAVAVVGLTLLCALLGAFIHSPVGATAQIVFIIPAVGAFVYFFSHAVRTNQELRRAREEIARLAVSEERLRFARDLHDLLGHTLSLIALKSELARRLVSTAPEQATAEIGDIELAARQALVEVREAVAAYRQPTFESELNGAQELLSAAGIAFSQQGEAPPLSPAVEAALAWAVREGVTNVIRHSLARSCVITLTRDGDRVGLEVRDDGVALPTAETSSGGSGLAGLRERVATLGGACEAGAAEGVGWRLVVSLPMQESTSVAAEAGEARDMRRRAAAWFG